MSIVDSIDEQIVRLLAQDARQSSETLAKQLNLSAATVRRRLRKLIKNELLHIVGIADPTNFGFPIAVVFALDVAHDKIEKSVKELATYPEIKWVSSTTGRFDVMAFGRFRSIDSLSEFGAKVLAHLEGVGDSETFVCLDVRKGRRVQLA